MIANDLKDKCVSNWKLMSVMEKYFHCDVNPLRDGVQLAYQKGFVRGIQKTPKQFSDNDLRFIRDALLFVQQGLYESVDNKVNILIDKIDKILEEE